MSPAVIVPSLSAALPDAAAPDSPEKVRDAASQFEALLIGQILRSMRESGGWLGANDPTASCAMEFAEQQFASLLAQQGGLGLAALIGQGLAHSAKAAHAADTPASGPTASPAAPNGLPGSSLPSTGAAL
jgi:peptidoglycan hydrolase FlgJ